MEKLEEKFKKIHTSLGSGELYQLNEKNLDPEKSFYCMSKLIKLEEEVNNNAYFSRIETFFELIEKFREKSFSFPNDFDSLGKTYFGVREFAGLVQVVFKLINLYRQKIDIECLQKSKLELVNSIEEIIQKDKEDSENGRYGGVYDGNGHYFFVCISYLEKIDEELALAYKNSFRNYRK